MPRRRRRAFTSRRFSSRCSSLPFSAASLATAVFSNHGPPPAIVDRIGEIAPRSTFLIWADPGSGGEDVRQPKYYAAARQPKQIWKVPGSGHAGGLEAQPAEYERRVVGFFDRALLGRLAPPLPALPDGPRTAILFSCQTTRTLAAPSVGPQPRTEVT